ncbi:hypothetical protein AYI69_g10637 [Smittium culicis]|uniref:Uncharacterized protein n=1 Tax=Smittium culicis TaxID=133412 RepID=A0A1R1X4F5_9FUNG|nr:hypothetical protein AYI69_g10637 [Smittium culicis]
MSISYDLEIIFATTMRALFADIAATITQSRLENFHKGLELHGDPTQLFESNIKPLVDQEVLDVIIIQRNQPRNDIEFSLFAGSNRARSKRTRTAAILLRRREPPLKSPLNPVTESIPASQIFARKVEAAERDLNRDSKRLTILGPPRYAQIDIVKNIGQ